MQLIKPSVILSFLLVLGVVYPARAGCMSDCEDEYQSQVEDCQLMNDSPDDYDSLQMCIDDARSEYEDCTNECQS